MITNAADRQAQVGVASSVAENSTNGPASFDQAITPSDLELRESEERYRTLFDLVPVAVYTIARDGVIQSFNRRAAELWGRVPRLGDTDERFCGSYRLYRPDGTFMPHAETPMALIVDGALSEVRDAEVIIERPDHSRITVVVNIRPHKNLRGEVIGAINCFYDITERKRTEEALRDADRRKDDFLAALGHELRSPLAAITTAATLLDQRIGSDPTAQRPIEIIARQGRHVARLMDDLLDTARIGHGKLQIEKRTVDVRSLVTQIVDTKWDPTNANPRHIVVVDLGESPIFIEADPTRLTQVLSNLLDNAVKFTPDGGRISVTAAITAGAVNIDVRDTGIGLSADHLQRIFDPFAQVREPRDPAQSGLGLGLSLVRGLIELHGGTVRVTSDGLGQGSCFTVCLPTIPPPAISRAAS